MVAIADLQIKYSADTSGAEAGTKKVEGLVSGLGSGVKGLAGIAGGFLLGGVVQNIAGGIGQLASAGLDFEANMANVNSIAQLSSTELGGLTDAVFALSGDPRILQGPAELASGLYNIYSSGFQGAEGLQVLEAASLAATAGLTSSDVAAQAITATLNAYGLGADQASAVSDVLFKTVDQGVITFEQLAQNLGNTLPIANSLGVGIEELGASYALMTLKGVSASQAETQIASLMRSALNPTTALTEAVNAHGYATAEAAIASEGLGGFLDIVTEASGGSSEAMMEMLGTQEAMNAALILGANDGKDFTDMLGEMENASGATGKALDKQMQSSRFAMASAKKEVERLAVTVMGALSPAIAAGARIMAGFLSNSVIPLAQEVGERLAPHMQRAGEVIQDWWVDRAGPALSQFWDNVSPSLTQFGNWLTGTAGPALLNFGQAVDDFIIGTAVPALSGLWDAVGPTLGQFADWFTGTAAPALASFAGSVGAFVTDTIVPALSSFWDAVSPGLSRFSDWLTGTAAPAVAGFLLDVNAFITNGVIPALSAVWDTVGPKLTQFSDWFTGTAAPAIAGFALDVNAFIQNIVIPALSSLWDTVGPKLTQLSDWITGTAAPAVIGFAQDVGTFITNVAVPALQDLWTLAEPYLTKVGNWLIDAVTWASDFATDIGTHMTTAKDSITGLWDGIEAVWGSFTNSSLYKFLQGVIDKANEAIEWLNKLPGVDIGGGEAAASGPSGAYAPGGFHGMGTQTPRQISPQGFGYFQPSLSQASEGVGGPATQGVTTLPNVGAGPQGVLSQVQGIAGQVTQAMTALASAVRSGVSQATAALQPMGAAFRTMATQVQTTVTQMGAMVRTQVTAMSVQLRAQFVAMQAQSVAVMTQMSAMVRAQFTQLVAAVTASTAQMRSVVQSGMSAMAAAGQASMAQFASGVRSGFAQAAAAAQSGVAAIRGAVNSIGSLYGQGYSIGSSFGQGVAAGLYAMLGAVQSAAAAIVAAAASAAAAAGRIASPSKLMRDEIGIPLAQGVIVGMESQRDAVARTFASMLPGDGRSGRGLSVGASARYGGGAPVQNVTIVTLEPGKWQEYLKKADRGNSAYQQLSPRSREIALGTARARG